MPDPVAWKLIEPGWRVRDAGGNEVGKVAEVQGDIEADIFGGITVKRGLLGKAERLSADAIGAIYDGEVVLAGPAPA